MACLVPPRSHAKQSSRNSLLVFGLEHDRICIELLTKGHEHLVLIMSYPEVKAMLFRCFLLNAAATRLSS